MKKIRFEKNTYEVNLYQNLFVELNGCDSIKKYLECLLNFI